MQHDRALMLQDTLGLMLHQGICSFKDFTLRGLARKEELGINTRLSARQVHGSRQGERGRLSLGQVDGFFSRERSRFAAHIRHRLAVPESISPSSVWQGHGSRQGRFSLMGSEIHRVKCRRKM